MPPKQPKPQPPRRDPGFRLQKSMAKSKASEFSIITGFKYGYRNREDITTLPPGVMVPGSQNVLTNVSNRLAVRKGYTLDGPANTSTTLGGIQSWFSWWRHTGDQANLRAWGTTLEYRYVDASGTVTWRTLMSGLASAKFNFAEFWDTTEVKSLLLFVNGASEINMWSGGVTTIASVGTNTLTKSGTKTWAEEGFLTGGTRKVTILGVDYTYTGGEGTTTLTGVTPDPALASPAISAGDIAHQTVRTTANSAMTSLPTMTNDVISNLRNQIYVGSFTNRSVYISKVNSYTDYSFATPRVVGQGAIVTLDGNPTGLVPLESSMIICAGKDFIYETQFTLSSDNADEQISVNQIKTTRNQAAQSQHLMSSIKNDIIMVTNEPTLDTLGRVKDVALTKQTANMSDPIKLDFDAYDFTDGSLYYHKYNWYVCVPVEGIVRVYNQTRGYWEAPQLLPFVGFYDVNGELYAHDYGVPQSYKAFDGYTDNGKAMEADAVFSFQNLGSRAKLKNGNAFYLEGYIQGNTTLNLGLQYDFDGCATNTSFSLTGTEGQFVCLNAVDTSLGKSSLGKLPLGGHGGDTDLPPKFRWIPTFNRVDFFEVQPSIQSVGIGQRWELIGFGGNWSLSNNEPVQIKE